MKPVVVVLTPSIDFARNDTSSMKTPGARYSGMAILLQDTNRKDASAPTVPAVRATRGWRYARRSGSDRATKDSLTERVVANDAKTSARSANAGTGAGGEAGGPN